PFRHFGLRDTATMEFLFDHVNGQWLHAHAIGRDPIEKIIYPGFANVAQQLLFIPFHGHLLWLVLVRCQRQILELAFPFHRKSWPGSVLRPRFLPPSSGVGVPTPATNPKISR